ncbi:pseudouridine synthase [Demequina zhanjiangensis]|uniref:RNA pseudouridylate synthase n=1 Tax=Demequina zhanjiangensis TaxID=3051659 RepID=A0ABT8G674_9MICO|nr:pseudouridine synthase [Demequina sp. SYSU T00b26]MDN4474214.1 pseudouridine synthase [Demequina sp. SYSU T00b26]
MPPRSPLPQRHGLDAAWVRMPGPGLDGAPPWATIREFLLERLPAKAEVERRLAEGEFVDDAGVVLTGDEAYRPHRFVWFHRPLEPEVPVPFPIEVLDRTDNLLVVDKPHFLATMPRGAHVRETALVKLRVALDLPELAPAHRLDRLTAGVLVFTTHRACRGAYAKVFQSRRMSKTYDAIGRYDASLTFPLRLVGRIEKDRGVLQARLVPGEPNAETLVEVVEVRGDHALYRLTPLTGKTHQLRLQMADAGLPLVGDPLYPEVVEDDPSDFSSPLRLVARRLRFTDPLDGIERDYVSTRALEWPADPPSLPHHHEG